jgi:hypothetical protein
MDARGTARAQRDSAGESEPMTSTSKYLAIPLNPQPHRAQVISTIMRELVKLETVFTDYEKGCEQVCFACEKCTNAMLNVIAMLTHPQARAWEVWAHENADDPRIVGLLYLTGVVPGENAFAHYAFFDRKLVDKTELIEGMIQWAFEDHPEQGWRGLPRLSVEIPEHAFALATHANRKLQFGGDFTVKCGRAKIRVEGVRRRSVRWRGRDENVLLMGRLR